MVTAESLTPSGRVADRRPETPLAQRTSPLTHIAPSSLLPFVSAYLPRMRAVLVHAPRIARGHATSITVP